MTTVVTAATFDPFLGMVAGIIVRFLTVCSCEERGERRDPWKSAALLVIDVQHDFIDEGAPVHCVGGKEMLPKRASTRSKPAGRRGSPSSTRRRCTGRAGSTWAGSWTATSPTTA